MKYTFRPSSSSRDRFRTFLDACAEISLVFTDFFSLGIAAELLGQVDVFDGQQTKIYVIVESFRADHLTPAEFSAFQCGTAGGIQ